jgi:hypothetical protein
VSPEPSSYRARRWGSVEPRAPVGEGQEHCWQDMERLSVCGGYLAAPSSVLAPSGTILIFQRKLGGGRTQEHASYSREA